MLPTSLAEKKNNTVVRLPLILKDSWIDIVFLESATSIPSSKNNDKQEADLIFDYRHCSGLFASALALYLQYIQVDISKPIIIKQVTIQYQQEFNRSDLTYSNICFDIHRLEPIVVELTEFGLFSSLAAKFLENHKKLFPILIYNDKNQYFELSKTVSLKEIQTVYHTQYETEFPETLTADNINQFYDFYWQIIKKDVLNDANELFNLIGQFIILRSHAHEFLKDHPKIIYSFFHEANTVTRLNFFIQELYNIKEEDLSEDNVFNKLDPKDFFSDLKENKYQFDSMAVCSLNMALIHRMHHTTPIIKAHRENQRKAEEVARFKRQRKKVQRASFERLTNDFQDYALELAKSEEKIVKRCGELSKASILLYHGIDSLMKQVDIRMLLAKKMLTGCHEVEHQNRCLVELFTEKSQILSSALLSVRCEDATEKAKIQKYKYQAFVSLLAIIDKQHILNDAKENNAKRMAKPMLITMPKTQYNEIEMIERFHNYTSRLLPSFLHKIKKILKAFSVQQEEYMSMLHQCNLLRFQLKAHNNLFYGDDLSEHKKNYAIFFEKLSLLLENIKVANKYFLKFHGHYEQMVLLEDTLYVKIQEMKYMYHNYDLQPELDKAYENYRLNYNDCLIHWCGPDVDKIMSAMAKIKSGFCDAINPQAIYDIGYEKLDLFINSEYSQNKYNQITKQVKTLLALTNKAKDPVNAITRNTIAVTISRLREKFRTQENNNVYLYLDGLLDIRLAVIVTQITELLPICLSDYDEIIKSKLDNLISIAKVLVDPADLASFTTICSLDDTIKNISVPSESKITLKS